MTPWEFAFADCDVSCDKMRVWDAWARGERGFCRSINKSGSDKLQSLKVENSPVEAGSGTESYERRLNKAKIVWPKIS